MGGTRVETRGPGSRLVMAGAQTLTRTSDRKLY